MRNRNIPKRGRKSIRASQRRGYSRRSSKVVKTHCTKCGFAVKVPLLDSIVDRATLCVLANGQLSHLAYVTHCCPACRVGYSGGMTFADQAVGAEIIHHTRKDWSM